MIKYQLLTISLVFGYIANGQSNQPCVPCLPGGITFETQAQIDNFSLDYPNCTEIDGNVFVHGDDITNLNGLGALTSLNSDLYITSNPLLTFLTGLDGVTAIGHTLIIGNNDSLKDITGLRNIISVGYSVKIIINPSLESLYGLENLDTVQGFLTISRNPLIQNLNGLKNLFYVGGSLNISGNDILSDLMGLENLSEVGGTVEVHNNPSLINLSGLDSLKKIGYSLSIFNNPSLINLNGMNALTSIWGFLGISYDSSLINMDGVENLNQVRVIIIRGNPLLSDISALENVNSDSLKEVDILDNNSLSNCSILSLCKYLEFPSTQDKIQDNAGGCNSPQEIKDSCAVYGIETILTSGHPIIYPNPSSDYITIETTARGTVAIHNSNGQQLLHQKITEPTTTIDVCGLKSGVYVVKLVGEKGVELGKFIKQ